VLTLTALTQLSVWCAEDVPEARSKLADVTRPSAPALTTELASVVPYTLPWAWADAFDADGRHGLLYVGRFAMNESVALFGSAGIPDGAPPARRTTAVEHVDDLPPRFRSGIGGVGNLDELTRAPAP
jgi:hypothetical protein